MVRWPADRRAWFHRDAEVNPSGSARGGQGDLTSFSLTQEWLRNFVISGGLYEKVSVVMLRENEGEVLATGRQRTAGEWVGMKVHIEGLELASDLEMHLGDRC